MTYRLLLDIAHAQLPLRVDEPEQIDQLRAYCAAGLVQAEFSCPPRSRDNLQRVCAQVLAITPLGQKEVTRQKSHSQLPGKRRRT